MSDDPLRVIFVVRTERSIGHHGYLSAIAHLLEDATAGRITGASKLVLEMQVASASDRETAAIAKMRWSAAKRTLELVYLSCLARGHVNPPGALTTDPPSSAVFREALTELVDVLRSGQDELAKKRGLAADVLLAIGEDAARRAPASDADLASLLTAKRTAPPRVDLTPGPLFPFHDLRVYADDVGTRRIFDGATLPDGVNVSRAGFGHLHLAEALRAELRRRDLALPGFDHVYVDVGVPGATRITAHTSAVGRGVVRVAIGREAELLRAICKGQAHEAGVALFREALEVVAKSFGCDPRMTDDACAAVLAAGDDVYRLPLPGYPPPYNRRR